MEEDREKNKNEVSSMCSSEELRKKSFSYKKIELFCFSCQKLHDLRYMISSTITFTDSNQSNSIVQHYFGLVLTLTVGYVFLAWVLFSPVRPPWEPFSLLYL